MSIKVFLSTLKSQVSIVDDEIYLQNKPIVHVWVQGEVTNVDANVRELYLDDGTDFIMVTTQSSHVQFENIKIGDYLMVQGSVLIGEHSETGETVTLLDARLINVLTDPNLKLLWKYEVEAGSSIREKIRVPY